MAHIGLPGFLFSSDSKNDAYLGDDTFPSLKRREEETFATMVDALIVYVGIQRASHGKAAYPVGDDPNLMLKVNCNRDGTEVEPANASTTRKLTISGQDEGWSTNPDQLSLECRSSEVTFWINDNSIQTFQDVKDSKLVVWVMQQYLRPPHRAVYPEYPNTHFDIGLVELGTATKRSLWISGFKKSRCNFFDPHIPCYIAGRIEDARR